MKKSKVLFSLLLSFVLLVNLVIPSTHIYADELSGSSGTEQGEQAVSESEPDIQNVDDGNDTSAIPEDEDTAGASAATDFTGQVITENIITSVDLYNQVPLYDSNTGALQPQGDKIEDVPPKIEDKVAVIFKWELPENHSYTEGSTYTFQLPNKFQINSQLTGDLDGGVGEYVVNPNREVTFTFNDNIVGQKTEGNFFVWIGYDKANFEDGLKQQFDFSSVGQGIIDVQFANTAVDKLTKEGKANRNGFNSDEVEWTVEFNQSETKIKGAVLDDTLPDGLLLKGAITITELEAQVDGTVKVKSGGTVQTATAFPVQLGDIERAYRVTYKTSVTAPTSEPFTGRTYTNKVALTGKTSDDNDVKQEQEGRVTISFNEPLKKTNEDYNPVTQNIKWKIQYNFNQQEIKQAQAFLNDQFNDPDSSDFEAKRQELVSGSVRVYEVTIDENGRGTRSGVASNYGVTDTANGFNLQFNSDINKAYEIEYETTAVHRIYKNATVANNVTIGSGDSKSATQGINENIFAKSVSKSDFNKKEIEWKIVLNSDLKEMTDIVITDDYADRNMQLKLYTDPETNQVDVQKSIQILGPNAGDFTLEALSGDNNYESGFIIKLKPGVTIDEQHVITYTTSFDPTAAQVPKGGVYQNDATLDWKEAGVSQASITKEAHVTPKSYTTDNGNKKGEYSAKDKQITWTVDVNYNLYDITDAVITDAVTGNQAYVPDSIQVHKLTLDSENNNVSIGDAVTLNAGDFVPATDGKSFTLKLGDIGKQAYRIVYKTSLDGKFDIQGNYSNHAVLNGKVAGDSRTVFFDKTATVTPAHGGEYVSKTGKQEGQTDKASWVVNINRSQSYIAENAVLTDTLSDNQILLADTLKLYKTNLPTSNSGQTPKAELVDPDDYVLEVKGNTYTITFTKAISTAYVLEYQSFINADNGDRLENKVEFNGQTSSVKGQDNQEGFQIYLAGAGGGASGGRGKITVKKVDDLGQPLVGAVFQIYNESGTVLIEELNPTDASGEAESVRAYRYSVAGLPYKIKEVSAPSGYLIDAEYGAASGKKVLFKAPNNPNGEPEPFTIENKKIRQGFQFTKVDSSDGTVKLAGAVFELYLVQGQDKTLIDTLTSGEDGVIAKGDLAAGDYELVEKEAPAYYEKDATPIPFTIVANQTEILTNNITNVHGTGGKLIVTKVDAEDNTKTLTGVEFELHDSTGKVIATETTDVNGIVEFDNLPYGKYTLVETKTAQGYVIDNSNIPAVEITSAETKVTIENHQNERSVKLIKYNSNKTQKLANATFELQVKGAFGYEVVTTVDKSKLVTNQNGEIYLTDLEPNEYQFVEVLAPLGYVLDKTPVEFEITTHQIESIVVEKTNNSIYFPPSPGGGENSGNPDTPTVPVTPENPITPTPVNPDQPEDTNPEQPVITPDTQTPGSSDETGGKSPGDENIDLDDDGTPFGGTKGDKPGSTSGNQGIGATLPQTGESSTLPIQLAGFMLVICGVGMLIRRYKHKVN